jgi:hypothetical protein
MIYSHSPIPGTKVLTEITPPSEHDIIFNDQDPGSINAPMNKAAMAYLPAGG